MFYDRKWDGVSEPNLDHAIVALRPDARMWRITQRNGMMVIDEWIDESNQDPPTPEEVRQKFRELMEIYQYDQYARDRQEMYGTIGEQLDMLFKDIESNNLTNGEWVNRIRKVKNTIPVNPNPRPDYTY